MKAKYNHTTSLHNLQAPREIVPVIMSLVSPKSVIDVGCGLGTFLKVFKENGVSEVTGIDGSWCKKELLFENISPGEFMEMEMEGSIRLDRRYDLAVCLEVAEHLSPQRADSFVDDLTRLSDVVLFSAAIPKQGGVNHLNEQWLNYWESKFKAKGFVMHDVLRPYFWDNPKVFSYYKQNMVLFTRQDYVLKHGSQELATNHLKNVIHPDLYTRQMDYKRKGAIRHFGKLLARAIRYKLTGK